MRQMEYKKYDVIVIGAGIAGMSTALSLDSKLQVAIVSKNDVNESSTYKAQGGIAVAVGPNDSADCHIADTLQVGKGICNREAVSVMVRDGRAALDFLAAVGAEFNRSDKGLELAREAGHSRHRVVHYYDYTGRHIAEKMSEEITRRQNIDCLQQSFLVDILKVDEECCGCLVMSSGKMTALYTGAVVIATGGYSGLFARSTNSVSSSGDGIASAYRAGAVISDMEFIQFHPTAFTKPDGSVFLLTEALRGEGAVLRNVAGERFMFSYHPGGELAPRDEVSRAIAAEMKREKKNCVYLDATHLGKEYLANRFRQVYSELAQSNLFMERDLIPIAPAAHYTIGGIKTDLWGKTTVPKLYACGEAAATGVHGANRLASNSLLEGVVFGTRIAQAINQDYIGNPDVHLSIIEDEKIVHYREIKDLQTVLERAAGVVRNEEEMKLTFDSLQQSANKASSLTNIEECHIYNTHQLAGLVLEAAILRRESRGTHFRTDFTDMDDVHFNKHILQQSGRKTILQ